jgi:hypothetical protein
MEHRIGSHTLTVEGDTAFITLVSDLQVDQVRIILSVIDSIGGGQGNFYVLADLRKLEGITPESRRLAGEWKGIARAGGTAIIGASVITRSLVTLVSRASTLLSKTRKTGEVAFFKTEDEARTWLATCRVRMAALRKARGQG